MNSTGLARRVTLAVGGSALVVMGALTAGCSTTTKEAPKTTSTPSSSASVAPSVTPTEKAAGGPHSFTPNPAPQPGSVCTSVVNGVCNR